MKNKLWVTVAVPLLLLVTLLIVASTMRGTSFSGSGDHGDARTHTVDPSGAGSLPALARPGAAGTGVSSAADRLGRLDPGKHVEAGNLGASQAGDPALVARAIVSSGEITVRPRSIDQARAEVLRMVSAWGGTVADEQTVSDKRGRASDSTLTLRVPTTRFAGAMSALADLGRTEQQSRSSEDVTTTVIDNAVRVRSAERSIRQIELLLGRAQRLGDIIAIESELARRQADLDSLTSQQAYLRDQTSLSTIVVHLGRVRALVRPEEHAGGFLTGLSDGWQAMQAVTGTLMTLVGAVLPFALALALFGLPLWLVVRRRGAGARRSAL